MAWQVALVLDTEFSVEALNTLVRQMPIWAVNTKERTQASSSIRNAARKIWIPDPAFTLFKAYDVVDREDLCRNILATVIEHHYRLAVLEVIGISPSPELIKVMEEVGFKPMTSPGHLRFRRSLNEMGNVREVVLNAQDWKTSDDIYASFFKAVGAPVWHGKNFNALRDSVVTGSINQIEVPYRIIVENLVRADDPGVTEFIDLIRTFEDEGCPIEVHVR